MSLKDTIKGVSDELKACWVFFGVGGIGIVRKKKNTEPYELWLLQ